MSETVRETLSEYLEGRLDAVKIMSPKQARGYELALEDVDAFLQRSQPDPVADAEIKPLLKELARCCQCAPLPNLPPSAACLPCRVSEVLEAVAPSPKVVG